MAITICRPCVRIKGIEIYGSHGFYPAERKIRQKFIFDVNISLKQIPFSNLTISDTVNYENVFKIIGEVMAQPMVLIEQVAHVVGQKLLDEFDVADAVTIQIYKRPQVGQFLESVSYECTLTASQNHNM
ncbi:MAG: dihydroneopterin aldolase [Saprospiraceae bacterium]